MKNGKNVLKAIWKLFAEIFKIATFTVLIGMSKEMIDKPLRDRIARSYRNLSDFKIDRDGDG